MFFLYFFTFQGTKRENKQIKKMWKNQYEKTKFDEVFILESNKRIRMKLIPF